jgi:signal transduction histidine kinase
LRLRAERVEQETLRTGMLVDLTKISHMLDETLEYLRGDAADEALSRVDLPSLLQTICSEFADVDQPVAYEGPSRLDWRVRPKALTRAVTNVVENGVKHAKIVKVVLSRGTGNFVDITVIDDGPGIPSGLGNKVFEPFFKADDTRTAGGLGFGLGLSIARDIVRQHNGEIDLIPGQTKGLKVRIRLPSHGPVEASANIRLAS